MSDEATKYFGRPADIKDRDCDWCHEPSAAAFEIYKPGKKVGTAQFLYPCRKHMALAQEASRAPRRAA